MQAAITLKKLGIEPVIVEKKAELGGKVLGWHQLFPSFTPAEEVTAPLKAMIAELGIEARLETEVTAIQSDGATLASGEKISAEATVVCSGFDLFDARLKEEYGYGVYDNVFTSADMEAMFREGKISLSSGGRPERIAILHCVGSRDEKVNQQHCSRLCCVEGVKQAIKLKKIFPETAIYNFYMDIRMFGSGYEELYRTAQQEFNIHFIRGRISEASQTIDSRIQIKAEDTLLGRPLKMTVDMLVLMIGMKGGLSNERFADHPAIKLAESGYIRPKDDFLGHLSSDAPNIFYAGTVTAPKNIGESLDEATAAAYKAAQYLNAGL